MTHHPLPRARRVLFATVTVVGALIACLVALEALLQLGALVVGAVRPEPERGADGSYVVLCLGESTTEGYGMTPYPELLERRLDGLALGVDFGVVNAGFVAETSPVLAERLEGLIEEHRPRMVITMMGVNDPFYFGETETIGLGVRTQLALLRSRTYRLARMAWSALRSTGSPAPSYSAPPRELVAHHAAFTERYWAVNERFNAGTARPEELRELILDARSVGTRDDETGTVTLVDAYRVYVYSAYTALTELLLDSGRDREAIALYREAVERHPEVEFFHRSLAGLLDDLGREEEARAAASRADALSRGRVLEITRRSYRRVERIARRAGIELVVMQYPMRDVDELRLLLDGSTTPRYVDNGPGFRRAVEEHGYDAIFVDRFAGDFGHCTERGNALIVEHLVEQVFLPLFGDTPGGGPPR